MTYRTPCEDNRMSSFLARNRERRLQAVGELYRKGRTRVLWINGVVYCGGTLFLLFNAVDYLVEPRARGTSAELGWFFAALAASILLGYLYGLFTWRNLSRIFGPDGGGPIPDQTVQ
jgi:hypothetical protein